MFVIREISFANWLWLFTHAFFVLKWKEYLAIELFHLHAQHHGRFLQKTTRRNQNAIHSIDLRKNAIIITITEDALLTIVLKH